MKKIFYLLAAIMIIQFPLYAHTDSAEDEILEAYELRISGKTQEALSILKSVLEKDPDNAMANFEIARTLPDDEKMKYIERAIINDPGNPMYEYYRANLFMLGAYKAMHEGNNEKIRKGVEQCCNSLERVLEIKPDCKESLLFLVDLYGNLPPEMGGNNEKAEKYLDKLKDVDPLYAAQGELYLADDEVDIVEYWQTYIDEHGKSQESIIKLGNANLQTNNIDQATECFKEVIAEDPSQKELYLQIARAHLYNAMRGGPEGETEIPLIKENIHKYLDMDGEKTTCVEAWCYGWLGMIEERGGNEDQAEIYFNKAKEIMPDFPRYTALPEEDRPPNLVAYQYSSYFSPF